MILSHVLQSYLFAYMFWFGMGLGCLGVLLLHRLAGGAWSSMIRPYLEAGARTWPVLALLFLPVALGLPLLYPWTRPEVVAADPILAHKHVYLNAPFFLARAAAYFVVWFFVERLPPAPAFLVYFLAASFCATDWTMSLEPLWYSTMYGAMAVVGQGLGAMALAVGAVAALGDRRAAEGPPSRHAFLDLGNMLLAFVMFWAYVSFSQYLIIWCGDLPEEISWYLRRQAGAWFWIAMIVIVAQFVLPFLALLGRANKQRLGRLSRIAALLVGARVVEEFWLVRGAFARPAGAALWLDALAFAAVGAAWLAAFARGLAPREAS